MAKGLHCNRLGRNDQQSAEQAPGPLHSNGGVHNKSQGKVNMGVLYLFKVEYTI
jgi:hypothetical protein